jgi:2-keto-4-pentenoate hydratase
MGVDQPDFGHLTASMFHLEQHPIPVEVYIQPRLEAFELLRSWIADNHRQNDTKYMRR